MDTFISRHKQGVPLTQEESLGRWISLLHRESKITIGKQLQEFGIGSGQHPALMILYEEDGLIQDDIAHRVFVDKATIGRAIQKLEQNGFVRREHDVHDKRAYRVFLTQKGRSVEQDVKRVLMGWTRMLASGFSDQERNGAVDALKRMHKNALDHRHEREGE